MENKTCNLKKQIWEKEAYITATNIEIDKIRIETKSKEETISKYKEENETLINKMKCLTTIKGRMSNSDKALSSNLINLRQYKSLLKKEVNQDNRKIEESLIAFNQDYLYHKEQVENRHIIYKKLKQAEIEFSKVEFDYKYHKVELDVSKERLKLKKEIQHQLVITNIVNFVKAVKEYKDAQKLVSQIETLTKQEAQLINSYEKKLKEKKNKTVSNAFQWETLSIPSFEQFPDFGNKFQQKKSVKFHFDDLSQLKLTKPFKEIKQLAKKNEDNPLTINRLDEKINIINVEHFNTNDFLLPEPPKKIRRVKTNEKMQNPSNLKSSQDSIITIKNCKFADSNEFNTNSKYLLENGKNLIEDSINKTGITQDVSSLKLMTIAATTDTKKSKYFQELGEKETSKAADDNIYEIPYEINSQTPLFDKGEIAKSHISQKSQSSQISQNSQKSHSSQKLIDNSTQESTFSQKMLRWKQVFDTSTFKTYETSISREEPTELTMSSTVDKVDLSKDLVAGLKGDEIMENYENVSFSPPQDISNIMNTSNIQQNFFKFEDFTGIQKPSFTFKDSQRFNMF